MSNETFISHLIELRSRLLRAVIAVLQAKRGLHTPRILLTLATGTGKTKIAFQLVWNP